MYIMSELAIVIPAYKADFFDSTLQSLASQTCKEFAVYIGDDCSPYDIYSIAEKYTDKLKLTYHRFENNLGGTDLVAHWDRCIQLTQGEPYMCLFSDDDIMGCRFVELFLNEINNSSTKYDLYHFDVKIINQTGDIIKTSHNYPNIIDSWTFYKRKATAKIDSFVVEYIFSREIYNKTNGFVKFELAWGSDIATWIKMGTQKGIKTINGEYVFWRRSNSNITPNHTKSIVIKKVRTEIMFLKWVNNFYLTSNCRRFNNYIFFRSIFFYSLVLNWKQACSLSNNAHKNCVVNYFVSVCICIFFPIIKLSKFCKLKFIGIFQ